jgi:electron transport complex protein RnfE
MKNNKLMLLLKGLILENPVLVLVLGTCPTLALSGNVVSALGMGIAATIVLICSNVVISALRRVIPGTVRIPCYIVIIAGFVTAVQMLMHAYLPSLYEMMGVYLALIVVNCIILGRAEMFASKNGVVDSAVDGLGMGLGFLLALFCMATVREVFGAATFAGYPIPFFHENGYYISILGNAPGGFLVYGVLIAVVNKIGVKKGEGRRKQRVGCEGCPSAAVCGKATCSETVELTANREQQSAPATKEAEGSEA